MLYTSSHFVAKPGHEEALAVGLRQLQAAAAPFASAIYVGRDLTRPGSFLSFGVWADRAANDAFRAHPDTNRLAAEAIGPHLDPDAGMPSVNMEPLA